MRSNRENMPQSKQPFIGKHRWDLSAFISKKIYFVGEIIPHHLAPQRQTKTRLIYITLSINKSGKQYGNLFDR